MIRSVSYRMAAHAFAFTGLWFVIGAIVLWSPLPGALGIGGAMFAAWLLIFFTALAASGATLSLAAFNGVFPPPPPGAGTPRPKRTPQAARQAGDPMWAPSASGSAPQSPQQPPRSKG